MKPAALLLDLDGTLVDSEPVHREAYRAYFEERGWEVPDLSIFTGRRAEDVFNSTPGPWTGQDPVEVSAAIIAKATELLAPHPIPGAAELVRAAAAAGVLLAIVTSATPPWVEHTLDRVLGVHRDFTTLVTAEDVVDGKPHPAGYRLAADRLGVEPEACVVVEDSPAGIRAALEAGVQRVIGLGTTHDDEALRAAGAVAVYADLRPVASWLE